MDHAEFLQAYYKELLNIKEKEVLMGALVSTPRDL
jgi:hypothetical protein